MLPSDSLFLYHCFDLSFVDIVNAQLTLERHKLIKIILKIFIITTFCLQCKNEMVEAV